MGPAGRTSSSPSSRRPCSPLDTGVDFSLAVFGNLPGVLSREFRVLFSGCGVLRYSELGVTLWKAPTSSADSWTPGWLSCASTSQAQLAVSWSTCLTYHSVSRRPFLLALVARGGRVLGFIRTTHCSRPFHVVWLSGTFSSGPLLGSTGTLGPHLGVSTLSFWPLSSPSGTFLSEHLRHVE